MKNKRESGLKDSGERVASVSGGLREPSDGMVRGRFDLIPPECLVDIFAADTCPDFDAARIDLCRFLAGKSNFGAAYFARFMLDSAVGGENAGLRLLACHYARGGVKYADRNWERGIETGRCVDSLFRHLAQLQAGMADEDHRSAVLWNTIALMWLSPRITDGRLPRELDTYGIRRPQPHRRDDRGEAQEGHQMSRALDFLAAGILMSFVVYAVLSALGAKLGLEFLLGATVFLWALHRVVNVCLERHYPSQLSDDRRGDPRQ